MPVKQNQDLETTVKEAQTKWNEKETKLKNAVDFFDREIKSIQDRKSKETGTNSKLFDEMV